MKAKEKVKVTTMNEMIPQIGKKVVVNEKEIGIFLSANGDFNLSTFDSSYFH